MINRVVKLYCLTLPLNVFTIELGGYPWTIPVVLSIILLSTLTIKNRQLHKKIFFSLTAFICFALLSTIAVHGYGKFIFSLGVFSCLALPIVFKFTADDIKGYDNFLIAGFLFTIPFTIYDLGVTFLNYTPLEKLYLLFSDSTNSPLDSYYGYYRVKSTFTEPSYYGLYLVSVLYGITSSNHKYKKIVTYIIIIISVSTVSLTAILLLLYIYANKIRLNKLNTYLYISIAIVLIILFVPSIYEITIFRLQETILSVRESNYYGSEGVRANSIFVMLDYLSQQENLKLLIGEGYSYYDKWLINQFGGDSLIGYSRGQIFNAIAVVGISLGIIGLMFYLAFFALLISTKEYSVTDIILHILIQFSLAYFVGYLFWSILMIIKFKNISIMRSN